MPPALQKTIPGTAFRNESVRAASRVVSPAVTALAATGTVFVSTYWLANRLTHGRADVGTVVFAWERAIPFVEWTIVPYLSIVAFFVASFFVGRHRADTRARLSIHAARLYLVLIVSLLCFALMPLRFTFERPATTGVTGLLFDALYAFDLPYNRAPSLHVSVLVILWARFAENLKGVLRAALALWFWLIGVSVLTTYQHHAIDVPAGVVLGLLCVLAIRTSSTAGSAAQLRGVPLHR